MKILNFLNMFHRAPAMLYIALVFLGAMTTSTFAQYTPPVSLETSQQQRQARFMVNAIGFISVDESGPDLWGSDEVVTYFHTRQSEPNLAVTRKVGNVDKGDTHQYAEGERCILPRRTIRNVGAPRVLQAPEDNWTCRDQDGVSGPIQFTVTMYEDDSENRFPICFTGPSGPGGGVEGSDCQDDLIGRATVSFTERELLQMMPRVDNTFVGRVTLSAPCGDAEGPVACGGGFWSGPEYRFGYRITRLADRTLQGPVVAPRE